ncbi:hypothetical protein D791_01952 [Nitrincola nitratireducens]|uniref:Uncharacterized protein n=1 Tax=Nitrincola nitratireducens TaxID=1229521 RepID=W9VKV3_9GAMM|nr:hypothetical protein D791_01952 [Nitrincola nitratireducens]
MFVHLLSLTHKCTNMVRLCKVVKYIGAIMGVF